MKQILRRKIEGYVYHLVYIICVIIGLSENAFANEEAEAKNEITSLAKLVGDGRPANMYKMVEEHDPICEPVLVALNESYPRPKYSPDEFFPDLYLRTKWSVDWERFGGGPIKYYVSHFDLDGDNEKDWVVRNITYTPRDTLDVLMFQVPQFPSDKEYSTIHFDVWGEYDEKNRSYANALRPSCETISDNCNPSYRRNYGFLNMDFLMIDGRAIFLYFQPVRQDEPQKGTIIAGEITKNSDGKRLCKFETNHSFILSPINLSGN